MTWLIVFGPLVLACVAGIALGARQRQKTTGHIVTSWILAVLLAVVISMWIAMALGTGTLSVNR
jgi:hypothetical protein